MTAKPDLGQRASICGIFKLDWQSRDLLQRRLQIELFPAEVWSKNKALRTQIDSAGQAHADSLIRNLGPHSGHIPNPASQLGHELLRVVTGRQRLLRDEMSVQVCQRNYRMSRPNVDPDYSGALFVKVQKSRPPPAQDMSDCAFGHPSFVDQLLGDHRDRAALKARVPGQISSRYRLVTSNQVQDNAPVDIARSFARRHLKIS